MTKHWTWIVAVGLLAAATAFAAAAPAAPEGSRAPVAAAPVLACPHGQHDGERPCDCQGDNAQGEHQCNGDGSCGCGHFVDENGDTICDNFGQDGCNGGGGCRDQQQQQTQ